MSNEPSPRPWRVVDPHYEDAGVEIFDAEGARVCKDLTAADAGFIADAVNLKTRIDEAMADEAGYLHPAVLDGKPMVCVTPPPSEAEESRMHREYEAILLVDRERFRRGYYEAAERNDRLRDLVKRFADYAETYHSLGVQGKSLVAEARAEIGGEKQ